MRSGRQVCALFEELPDEEEYPDYYEVIKQPIALQQIEVNHFCVIYSISCRYRIR
jgi:hypothetical protein